MSSLLNIILVTALLFNFLHGLLDQDTVQLVDDYFRYVHVRVVIVVTCTHYDAVRLMKSLDVWTSAVGPDRTLSGEQLQTTSLRVGIFVDGNCPSGKRVLQDSAMQNRLNLNTSWLVQSSEPPSASLAVRLDTDLTWATPQQPGIVSLSDVYRITMDQPLNVTPAGHWSQQGLQYTLPKQLFNGRRTLHGAELYAAVVINNLPLDNLVERLLSLDQKNIDAISRFGYAIFLNLGQIYNFTMKLVPTKSWGYIQKDGSYDGTTGMLGRWETNVTVSPCYINPGRMDVTDFTGPSWMFQAWIMFRHPPTVGKHNTLLLPFSTGVWLFSGLLFLIAMGTLRLQHWAGHHYNLDTKTEDSWSSVLVFSIGSVSQQGTEHDSKQVSWRVIILFMSWMAFMLDTFYSGAVTFSLLLPAPRTIRTKRDLVDSPLEVGAEDISYTRDYFARTTEAVGKELYHKKIFPPGKPAPNYFTLEEGVERMRTRPFAYHAEDVSIMPIIRRTFDNRAICSISRMPLFAHHMCYHNIGKNSPLKEMITLGLRTVWQLGHLKRHEHIWRPRDLECNSAGDIVVIGMDALLPAFVLFAAGGVVAFGILLPERRHKPTGKYRASQ